MDPLPRDVRPAYGTSVAVLIFVTAAATLSGFFRELMIANFFGASAASDAISVVVYLYDMACLLFYQGALANTIVPLMAGYGARGDLESQQDLVAGVGLWLAVGGVVLGLALAGFGDSAARVFFAARGPASLDALALALRLGAAGLVCVSLASFLASVLQAEHRYNAFPVGRMAWNVVAIALMVIAPAGARFPALLAGLSLGGLAQLAVTVRAMPRRLWRWRPSALLTGPARQVARGSVPTLLGAGLSGLILGLGERALLALLPPGNVAIASFAQRTATLASTAGLAFLTVSFTHMSLEHGRASANNVAGILLRTVREGVFLLAPVAGVVLALAQPIVSILFRHGAFSAADAIVTSGALRLYGLSLIPGFLSGLLSRMLFAVNRPWAAVATTVSVTLVALAWDVALIGRLGVFAIPLGYTIGLTVSCVVAIVLARRALGVGIGPVLPGELRALPVAVATAVLIWMTPLSTLTAALGLQGKAGDVATVTIGGFAYAVIYLAISAAVRIPQVGAIYNWVVTKRRARAGI